MSQKIVSSVVIAIVLAFGAFASAAAGKANEASPLPSVRAVLPNPLPLSIVLPMAEGTSERIQTTTALTIYGDAPKAPGKVWTCGAFEPLENDNSQTVRRCEWR